MTAKQIEVYKKAIREQGKLYAQDPDAFRQMLVRTGMYTKKGTLKKEFR